jgi:hypothetical protein
VAHSVQQLVGGAACDAIVEEAEAHASARGGWSSARHNSYPTTDVPLQVALAPDEPPADLPAPPCPALLCTASPRLRLVGSPAANADAPRGTCHVYVCARHAHGMRTACARHAHGIYLQELPRALQWLREELLPELAWPLLARAFPHLLGGDHLLPHRDLPPGGDGGGGDGCAPPGADARAAIRVSEAFVVRPALGIGVVGSAPRPSRTARLVCTPPPPPRPRPLTARAPYLQVKCNASCYLLLTTYYLLLTTHYSLLTTYNLLLAGQVQRELGAATAQAAPRRRASHAPRATSHNLAQPRARASLAHYTDCTHYPHCSIRHACASRRAVLVQPRAQRSRGVRGRRHLLPQARGQRRRRRAALAQGTPARALVGARARRSPDLERRAVTRPRSRTQPQPMP